jgi:catechol 2,3-dioxygenase-like lactoylglutathione lyase family enzyme
MSSVSLGMIRIMAIESLDVLYLPSRDAEADLAFFRDVLGARVVFAIEAMGTRVAEVSLSPKGSAAAAGRPPRRRSTGAVAPGVEPG